MKGEEEGGVLFRDSSSLADTGIGKKNISNERNPLFAARQEFEELPRHDDPPRGNCSYVEKYYVGTLLFLGENWDWQE